MAKCLYCGSSCEYTGFSKSEGCENSSCRANKIIPKVPIHVSCNKVPIRASDTWILEIDGLDTFTVIELAHQIAEDIDNNILKEIRQLKDKTK